jgi:hypothetical protein
MADMSNIEKAIPICQKIVATAEEILKGCGGVCRIVLQGKEKDTEEGLLSCSIGIEGHNLAVCIWKERKDGRYEKACHFKVGQGGLLMLQGFMKVAAMSELEGKG